jgi:hypothetical protein
LEFGISILEFGILKVWDLQLYKIGIWDLKRLEFKF